MLDFILNDICDILPYTLFGLIIGVAVFSLCLVYYYKKYQSLKLAKSFVCLILVTYLVVVLKTALFSREPGSRDMVDLIPFSTWGIGDQSHAYVIENIIMFIPFGLLTPVLLKRLRDIKWMVSAAALTSLLIETVQYITKRGYFQTDDVIMNVLGAVLGFSIWLICRKLYKCS